MTCRNIEAPAANVTSILSLNLYPRRALPRRVYVGRMYVWVCGSPLSLSLFYSLRLFLPPHYYLPLFAGPWDGKADPLSQRSCRGRISPFSTSKLLTLRNRHTLYIGSLVTVEIISEWQGVYVCASPARLTMIQGRSAWRTFVFLDLCGWISRPS